VHHCLPFRRHLTASAILINVSPAPAQQN